jgi:hypothetical protein
LVRFNGDDDEEEDDDKIMMMIMGSNFNILEERIEIDKN